MGKSLLLKPGIAAGMVLAAALSAAGAARADQASISTVFASYGYAMERKDVKDDVVKLCDGKPSCKFVVRNENFNTSKGPADPSPGNDKGLMVSWKCGDVAHKVQFAEGRPATLDCD
ncbi:MAG: Galactose binding lectin domain [Rhodospirillales bacterium]|nr:Galactose binding lectin domain [Rhodospirillales bacterium]